jgi:N-acetylglutamate synthase-like GNAT family acetyltransferase
MSYELRPAVYKDAGQIAYLILLWDAELPQFLRMVRGSAEAAYRAAELMCSPSFVTWVAEDNGELIGAVAIHNNVSLFGFHGYGNVAGVFVLPKYRGGKLIGLRLIKKAMELKSTNRWEWLEMNPWADDTNTKKVLERLGFEEAAHTYVLR